MRRNWLAVFIGLSVIGLVDAALGARLSPLCANSVVITTVSSNPAVISSQLDLSVAYARQILDKLQKDPAAETPASLDASIGTVYRQIAAALGNVNLKRQAARNARFTDPLFDLVAEKLNEAATAIRNARHTATAFSPEGGEPFQRLVQQIEATISAVEQAKDLL